MSMIETIVSGLGDDGIVVAAQLVRDVNVRYEGLALSPDEFAFQLEDRIAGDHLTLLDARLHGGRKRGDAGAAVPAEQGHIGMPGVVVRNAARPSGLD